MKRRITLILVPLLAAALAGCGSGREEGELIRRVAQADAAAKKAEAAAARAEEAAARAVGGGATETVYEEAPDDDAPESDEVYGAPTEPEPADG